MVVLLLFSLYERLMSRLLFFGVVFGLVPLSLQLGLIKLIGLELSLG